MITVELPELAAVEDMAEECKSEEDVEGSAHIDRIANQLIMQHLGSLQKRYQEDK